MIYEFTAYAESGLGKMILNNNEGNVRIQVFKGDLPLIEEGSTYKVMIQKQ